MPSSSEKATKASSVGAKMVTRGGGGGDGDGGGGEGDGGGGDGDGGGGEGDGGGGDGAADQQTGTPVSSYGNGRSLFLQF